MKSIKDILSPKSLPQDNGYYVYLLLCQNNSLYCGWTTNLVDRLEKHKDGTGAKYTRANPPLGYIYYETFSNRSDAMKREIEIKRLSRRGKEGLLNPD